MEKRHPSALYPVASFKERRGAAKDVEVERLRRRPRRADVMFRATRLARPGDDPT